MPKRRRECDGKVPHPDRTAALEALRTLTVNRFTPQDTMRVYECPKCSAWHVGHRRGVNSGRDRDPRDGRNRRR